MLSTVHKTVPVADGIAAPFAWQADRVCPTLEGFVANVDGRVHVAVVGCAALNATPLADIERQRFDCAAAFRTAFARRNETANLDERASAANRLASTTSSLQMGEETTKIVYATEAKEAREGERNMPAKLPERWWGKPERYLREIQTGETAHINFPYMQPNTEGECFLNPDARIETEAGLFTIQVERRADGYHVTIDGPESKLFHWLPGRFENLEGWYPVASITDDDRSKHPR